MKKDKQPEQNFRDALIVGHTYIISGTKQGETRQGNTFQDKSWGMFAYEYIGMRGKLHIFREKKFNWYHCLSANQLIGRIVKEIKNYEQN